MSLKESILWLSVWIFKINIQKKEVQQDSIEARALNDYERRLLVHALMFTLVLRRVKENASRLPYFEIRKCTVVKHKKVFLCKTIQISPPLSMCVLTWCRCYTHYIQRTFTVKLSYYWKKDFCFSGTLTNYSEQNQPFFCSWYCHSYSYDWQVSSLTLKRSSVFN